MQSHGFRQVSKSVTVNDGVGLMAVIFPGSYSCGAYVKVIKDYTVCNKNLAEIICFSVRPIIYMDNMVYGDIFRDKNNALQKGIMM